MAEKDVIAFLQRLTHDPALKAKVENADAAKITAAAKEAGFDVEEGEIKAMLTSMQGYNASVKRD